MHPSALWYVSDSFFYIEKYRERPFERAVLRLTHIRERELAVPPFRFFRSSSCSPERQTQGSWWPWDSSASTHLGPFAHCLAHIESRSEGGPPVNRLTDDEALVEGNTCRWRHYCVEAPLQKIQMCRGILLITFGGFRRVYSWMIFLGTFSQKKWGEKIQRKNPLKNPVAQK